MDGDTVPSPGVVAQHKTYGDRLSVVLGRVRRVAEDKVMNTGIPDVQRQFAGFDLKDDKRLELGGVYRNLQQQVNGDRQRYMATPPSSYRFCWSCHMSVPLDLTRTLGGFWEKFTTFGGEDQELGLRLFKAGCNIVVDFHIESWHLDHPLRGDPNSNQHHQTIAESSRQPTLVRNGGPIRPLN
jgi:GT2 family glycosyltransferase